MGLKERMQKLAGIVPEREQAFRALEVEAQERNAEWCLWGEQVTAILDEIELAMKERARLERSADDLRRRATQASMKHKGEMTFQEAEFAPDLMALRRVIDGRFKVHALTQITVCGIPSVVIGLLSQTVKERVAKLRLIEIREKDRAADRDALKNAQPVQRTEIKPDADNYFGGVYLGVTLDRKRERMLTADEKRVEQINRDMEREERQANKKGGG